MKMYCAMLINEISGDIEHCITSDAPIEDKMIPTPDIPVPLVKTIPPTPKITFRKCFCEFECDSFARGREVLDSFKMSDKTKKAKLQTQLNSKFKNLKETNETDMALDYAELQASKL